MHFDGFLPKQVEGHACVYIPETQSVFIFGGFDSLGVTDRIMKYNFKTKAGSLVFGQKLAESRENLVAELLEGDRIVVSSGWNGHASSTVIDTFQYDRSKDTIKRLDAMLIDEKQVAGLGLSAEDADQLRRLQNVQIKRNRPCSVAI